MHEVNQQREIYFYGNVGLTRVKCPKCRRWAIVLNNRTACCEKEIEFDDSKPKMYRVAIPPHARKELGKRKKGKILKSQGSLRAIGASIAIRSSARCSCEMGTRKLN